MGVDRVDPVDGFRFFNRVDIEVDDHRFVIAAHQHALKRSFRVGINFLVRDIRRNKDEVAGFSFSRELKMFAPAHARFAAYHVNHAFEGAMVMCAGFCIGVDFHRAGPDFLCTDTGVINRRSPAHARGLRGVGVELVAFDDFDAVFAPIGGGSGVGSVRSTQGGFS